MEQYKYLIKVEPGANNNKFYEMKKLNDSEFEAVWGRVGNSGQSMKYSVSQWNKKLNEKIAKGYEDKTENMSVTIVKSAQANKTTLEYAQITITSVKNLVNKLLNYVSNTINTNYNIKSKAVTKKMIDNAQYEIDKLYKMTENTSVDEFNKVLLSLFKIIPRKMSNVADVLKSTKKENYANIIKREQDLLDVMKGRVVEDIIEEENSNSTSLSTNQKTILEAMGIEIEEINNKDKDIILDNLGSEKHRFSNAWRVINHKTENNFKSFISKHNITNNKMFWHGSKNANWWSILTTGLILRPNAPITGKMFGYGIYFADKAKKSIGYTSLNGSYWARGNDDVAYLSLYEVALGNEYVITNRNSSHGELTESKLRALGNYHSVFAKGGYDLINNEYIVYNDNQCTVRYIVEIK